LARDAIQSSVSRLRLLVGNELYDRWRVVDLANRVYQKDGQRHVIKSSAVAQMGDRLAAIDVGGKVGKGTAVPLSVGAS